MRIDSDHDLPELEKEVREARLVLAWAGSSMAAANRAAAFFGHETDLLGAGAALLKEAGIDRQVADRIVEIRKAGAHRAHEEVLRNQGGRTIVYGEPGFPKRLLEIPGAPAALFVRGRLPREERPVVAVIGSRRSTLEGQRFAFEIAESLGLGGVPVVSGLARGIDSAALRGNLRGRAMALGVLASGLDYVYPPENRNLYEEIAGQGALVTEFPLGVGPRRGLFPRRNRLISGLADGVLVVEAAEKSGTLITVDHALEQDRVVMAVPGCVRGPFFKGTNRLIRDGAQVILSIEDVCASLGVPVAPCNRRAGPAPRLPKSERTVLEACRENSATPDAIARDSGLAIQDVLCALARLETRGLVGRHSGQRFLAVSAKAPWQDRRLQQPESGRQA
jgi:DNA processing protein